MSDIYIPLLKDLPAPPRRIILHWTGGGAKASQFEREHYHYLVEQTGKIVEGFRVAANMRKVSSRAPYAAHTKGFNSFSVGVSFCGMAGVNSLAEWNAGKHGRVPLLEAQMISGCRFVGQLCSAWGLPVKESTVFTHAEAERLHDVDQNGKWDIDVLAFLPSLSPAQVGAWIRNQVSIGTRS